MGSAGATGIVAGNAWLPPLVFLADYGGDWHRYLEAVYDFFRQDFVVSSPQWKGKRVGAKRHPIADGKEATFWHLITEGRTEAERLPDLRRCERIRWPRPIIEATPQGRVRCWTNRREHEARVVIALDDFSYVVVLAQRKGYVILWAAYCVEKEHRRQKLRKEFDRATKG
jgi:hypothetical protein